jgi:hypothetical protein
VFVPTLSPPVDMTAYETVLCLRGRVAYVLQSSCLTLPLCIQLCKSLLNISMDFIHVRHLMFFSVIDLCPVNMIVIIPKIRALLIGRILSKPAFG